ncbi:MAG: NADH-quinone oxidoreductase subunit J [Alloprevotella sp.]|nr:NADH-quinone oxidoreductase subunit J [Alloprevotella sp.]
MDSYNIMFIILAVMIVLSSFATVLTKSVLRAAAYLFFALLGVAGMYFLLGYTFLGSVQVMVYCGGIVVLYVFAILLTRGAKDKLSENTRSKIFASALLSLAGFGAFVYAIFKANLLTEMLSTPEALAEPSEGAVISINEIGQHMLSTDVNGYLLPFEAVSVLLLACIVAALVIARKR